MAHQQDPEKFGVDTDVHPASPGKGDSVVHETESSPGRSLFNGTIKLTTSKGRKQEVVLIPQPTVDPRGTLTYQSVP